MQTITPFLWFDSNAEEAVEFYTSVFPHSKVGAIAKYPEGSPGKPGTVMTVDFTLCGQTFTALNGGPVFPFSPAVSLFIACETKEEVDGLWAKLSEGGKALMPLDTYPFSERYGWCNDKYGVSWQIFVGKKEQKITPALMFIGKNLGKAEEAMNMYTNIFPASSIVMTSRYPEGMPDAGLINHAEFSLHGSHFIAMDSGYDHQFAFTQALSFVINCDTQEEIDMLWEKLGDGGEHQQCGWVIDKYGVAWQVVPAAMNAMMTGEAKKVQAMFSAMLTMNKLDIAALRTAYEGA